MVTLMMATLNPDHHKLVALPAIADHMIDGFTRHMDQASGDVAMPTAEGAALMDQMDIAGYVVPRLLDNPAVTTFGGVPKHEHPMVKDRLGRRLMAQTAHHGRMALLKATAATIGAWTGAQTLIDGLTGTAPKAAESPDTRPGAGRP